MDTTRSRSSTPATAGAVSSAARTPYAMISSSRTSAVTFSSLSTQPPRPRSTRDALAISVERALAGGAEQLDLLGGDRLHGVDAGRLDRVGLADLGVVAQHLAHL